MLMFQPKVRLVTVILKKPELVSKDKETTFTTKLTIHS